MRRWPRSIRCSVPASPPAQFVAPTLTSSGLGRLTGSMTTSGMRARANARHWPMVSLDVTTITPRRFLSTTSRTHVAPLRPWVGFPSTMSAPSCSPASVTPRMISSM